MEELDIATVTKRSIKGVFALVSRTFLVQAIGFIIGVLLLPAFLSKEVYGIFYVVSAVIAFLSYFSDIGLAASLIQKKESITQDDLKTTFTIQQALIISVAIIALLLSGIIGEFYRLREPGIHLFQALIVAFFLSSLKTVPSIILERDLRFEKLVIPQIVETLFFYVTALIFAMKGFGVASFTFAVLARGIAGVIAIYIIAPWKINLGFSRTSARKLLSFGIPFQANSLLALVKDDLLIAYLGKVLPLGEVGYIGFAQKWAFTPLRLIMDHVIRITFPSFSRLQHDKNFLGRGIEKSLFGISFFVFPSLVGLVVFLPFLITLIPKYHQWEPAILSLVFFALNAAFSSISTPLTNALSAIGKIKTTLYFMVFWTVATWILTPLFIFSFGFNGVALSSAIVAVSAVVVIYITKRHIRFSVYKIITKPFISTFLMGIVIYFLSPIIIKNIPSLLLMIIMGGILYLGIILLIAKREILADIKLVKQNLLS